MNQSKNLLKKKVSIFYMILSRLISLLMKFKKLENLIVELMKEGTNYDHQNWDHHDYQNSNDHDHQKKYILCYINIFYLA